MGSANISERRFPESEFWCAPLLPFASQDSTQQSVYDNTARGVVDSSLAGYNATIFAYGQTGSGKSFSMTGSPDQPGIIRQMNEEMFTKIAATQAGNPDLKFLVTCSFMEIYNEVRGG